MNRKVSILINNYNYARFLRQAINSALDQTYPHVEVVVVDDGSTDHSVELIRSYGDRLRPVFQQNGGQASAFNAGFANSTGEIIAFLDSDDYLSPTAIERILSEWDDETDILHHRLQEVDQSGIPRGDTSHKPVPLDAGNVVPIILSVGQYVGPPTSGLVYSRRILNQLLPMPEEPWRICADAYLFTSAPFLSKVTVINQMVAYYRIHGSNNFGFSAPRRSMSRSQIEKHLLYGAYGINRVSLIKDLAHRHRFPIPEFPQSDVLFLQLLLNGTSPKRSAKRGFVLCRDLLWYLWTEPRRTFRYRAQKTIAGVLLLVGPRPLLRLIYPGMFRTS